MNDPLSNLLHAIIGAETTLILWGVWYLYRFIKRVDRERKEEQQSRAGKKP